LGLDVSYVVIFKGVEAPLIPRHRTNANFLCILHYPRICQATTKEIETMDKKTMYQFFCNLRGEARRLQKRPRPVDKKIFVSVPILTAVLFPIFLGMIPFQLSITFDPVLFLINYGDFIFEVVAIPTVLILLNSYWTRKQRQELIVTTSNSLRLTVDHLKALATECGELINSHVYIRAEMTSFEREQRLLSLITRIQNLRKGALTNYRGSDTYGDEKLNNAINYLWTSVIPVIDRLTEITHTYPDVEEIREELGTLIIGLDLLIRKLNGDKVR
jgi:hypothetical protein